MKKELDKELYPDYVYPEFTPDPGKPFREPIAKLGKKITDRIPQKLGLKKITRNDPEYWGLAGVLTDEEALLALKLGVRKPKTLSEIVKISGLEKKKCEALLEEMSRKGLLEYNWENAAHEKQYVLPMYVPGCAEFFNMNAKILESNPEMGTFFEHMSRLPLEKITPFVPEGRVPESACMSSLLKKQSRWKMNLLIWNIFPTGLVNMRENMQQALVPAVVPD